MAFSKKELTEPLGPNFIVSEFADLIPRVKVVHPKSGFFTWASPEIGGLYGAAARILRANREEADEQVKTANAKRVEAHAAGKDFRLVIKSGDQTLSSTLFPAPPR